MSEYSKEASLCRILVSAGGTGGHIFPALAVAEYMNKRWTCEWLFVGATGRMEMDLVPKAGFAIEALPMRGFQRGQLWANLGLPWRLLCSVWRAYGLLRRFRPDVLFGTGGYASLPVLCVGAWRGLPTLILEPNAWAGWTNRFLSRYVDKVCVSYPNMERFFAKKKLLQTGTPLRGELHALGEGGAARRKLGLAAKPHTLLVIGGSLGSATLNRCMLAGFRELLDAGYQIIWQTGTAHYARIQAAVGELPAGMRVVPFIDRIGQAYAAATLVVARAGALSIAELLQVAKPAIFVPAPHVAEDHQRHNAEALVRARAAYCVLDAASDQALLPAIHTLMQDQRARHAMSKAMRALVPTHEARATVAKQLLALAHKKPHPKKPRSQNTHPLCATTD